MAIQGQQTINIGPENTESGSDNLYDAFNKIQNNFTTLFSTASPYVTYNPGAGIGTYANGTVVNIINTGVVSLASGTGIALSGSNGNITISATGNGNVGVTYVGVTTNTLNVSGSPIVSSGNIVIDLPMIPPSIYFAAGEYIAPTLTVDEYGRINAIANGVSIGTVDSIAITAGDGLSITGSPITSNGTISITNTGVTRINAGTGIDITGSTGEITISSTNLNQGTVTRIDFSSNNLTVTGSPVTSTGNVTFDLPSSFAVSGTITANSFVANIDITTANLTATDTITANNISANLVSLNGDDTVLEFLNTAGNSIQFLTPNSITDSQFYVPESGGTIHQLMGITSSGSPQSLGWKTIPVQYVTVNLRPTGSFDAPFYPVLRSFPLNTRTGIVNLNLT